MLDLRYGNTDFSSLKCPVIDILETKGLMKERTHIYEQPYKVSDILSRHSIAKGSKFYPYLEQINKFLQETSKEFIIIKMREENKVTQEQRDFLVSMILKILGPYMITQSDVSDLFSLDSITVGKLMNKPKRIFFMIEQIFDELNDEPTYTENPMAKKEGEVNMDIIKGWDPANYEGLSYTKFGFFPDSLYLNDYWYNEFFLEDFTKIVREDKRITEEFNNKQKNYNQFRCFQFALSQRVRHIWTPLLFIFRALPMHASQSSKLFSEDQFLATMFLRELQSKAVLNVIMIDCVENHQDFIRLLIASNYDKKLVVSSIKIDNKDITHKFEKSNKLSMKNNIWFLNKQDLDKIGSGNLEVEFSFKTTNICLKKRWNNVENLEMVYIDCFDFFFYVKNQGNNFLNNNNVKEEKSCLEEFVEEHEYNLFSPFSFMINLIRKGLYISRFSDLTKRLIS